MAKKFLHHCICTHARAHMHYWRRVCMHVDRCIGHHACAGVYVRRVLWTSAYTFANTLATDHFWSSLWFSNKQHYLSCSLQEMHMRVGTCRLFVQCWGNEDGGVQLIYERTCCLAWVFFLTEWKIGVSSVSFLFLTRVGGYVGVCVCIRTHIHTLHRWGNWMWAQESGGDHWRARTWRIRMD